jgi:hypothetical protein
MVLTETINYHANHIGAIRTNKDRLKDEFNVGIVITRIRFGEYQAVDITGYTKDIKIVKQKLQEIVDIAEYEYKQYRLREKARRWEERNIEMLVNSSSPQIPLPKKKSNNPFEALNGLDDNNEYPELPELPEVISSSNASTCWADMID